eukprot:TRINITY_DN2357_c0_g1_i1.p1 TRINITY_DN2357_c0_g1~~TRINITY_DN2357_c0_g1_i1.p1  ORF type:complete len:867 (-),score=105.52 TRINITY_DN2357_c0_g1_i1:66-2666(-)
MSGKPIRSRSLGTKLLDDTDDVIGRTMSRSRSSSRSRSKTTFDKQEMWSVKGAWGRQTTTGSDLFSNLESLIVDMSAIHVESVAHTDTPLPCNSTSFASLSCSKSPSRAASPKQILTSWVAQVPGLLIATVMNVMLSVPFGLAFFPTTWEPFPVTRAIGLQMFFLSTFVCQVVMTVGSDFPCAVGLAMVENIPFMHSLASIIIQGQGKGIDALATTMVAFAISSLLIGAAFYLLGKYNLGKATNYIPRHFIIGCIGGIGLFVIQTGIEVSTATPWAWNLASMKGYVSGALAPLWVVPVALVMLMHALLRFWPLPLLPPFFFISIIPVFYIVLWIVGCSPDVARESGWLFPHPPETNLEIMWSLFNFRLVRWDLILEAMPTLAALTLFGLIHAPINIPSLSMTTGHEADMNRELMVHGYSNLIAGLTGALPNYLCYSNSLLYFKCGGSGRPSGFVLAAITGTIIIMGPGALAYVPRCMAGCLLINVGLDLAHEALIDSLNSFDTYEYVSVLLITITISMFDMTVGLGLGLVLSAMSFTLQHMQHSEPVRRIMPATTLRSSTTRTESERSVLNVELRRVMVMQLQGTLFFGNATTLLSRCNELLEKDLNITTIIVDFTLVASLESSAAEAIAKIFQIAQKHSTTLVYNRGSTEGFPTCAPLSSRLACLGTNETVSTTSRPPLYISDDLDEALKWVEDIILAEARAQNRVESQVVHSPSSDVPLPLKQLWALCPQESEATVRKLFMLMSAEEVEAGHEIWHQGDIADSCLLLSEGQLVNLLEEEAGTAEDCFPGCLVGEFCLLSKERRMGTLIARKFSVVYKLHSSVFETIKQTQPQLAYVISFICIKYLGSRCCHIANRIWDTRCLPV